jgi:hypothetical protein
MHTWISFDEKLPPNGCWFQPAGWVDGKWIVSRSLYDAPASNHMREARKWTHYIVNDPPPMPDPFDSIFEKWVSGRQHRLDTAGTLAIPLPEDPGTRSHCSKSLVRHLVQVGWSLHEQEIKNYHD